MSAAGKPLLAVLVLTLAACGNEAPAQPASEWPSFDAPAAVADSRSPLPRACALLGAEQAQAVLASEAGLMADEPESCIWTGSAGVGHMAMLNLTVLDNEDEAMAATLYNSLAGAQGNLAGLINQQVGEKTRKSGQDIDDLGDEAWLSAASFGESFGRHGVGAQQLVVRKGRRLLHINVTGTSRMDGLAQRMEVLARAAVPQL
jgi:hypothetical protein